MNEPSIVPLRERQMRLGREAILNVAFEQFCDRGYSKTTIQNIAELAGVGPATVFRHFRSKLGLLTALIQRDLVPIFEAGEAIMADPADNPVEAVGDLLENLLNLLDAPSKAIESDAYRKHLFDFGKIEIGELMSFADGEACAQIRTLLQYMADKGKINPALNLDHMATILFQVFNHHYYELERNLLANRKEKAREMKERIAVMFQPWLSS